MGFAAAPMIKIPESMRSVGKELETVQALWEQSLTMEVPTMDPKVQRDMYDAARETLHQVCGIHAQSTSTELQGPSGTSRHVGDDAGHFRGKLEEVPK